MLGRIAALAAAKIFNIDAAQAGSSFNILQVNGKIDKKKVTLAKGETVKLEEELKNGKLEISEPWKVAYESDDPEVAVVSKSGKVKAVGEGTCIICAYTQDGVFAAYRITVK